MAGWRRLYGSEWKHGAERVEIVKKKIESWECGLVVTLGFMANSTQQVLVGMPNGHEKGEPDLKIWRKKKHIANIEVTGSWKNIQGYGLFLRPDKVAWAKKHPIPKTWAWFVYNDNEFVKECMSAGQCPIVEKNLSAKHTFVTIPISWLDIYPSLAILSKGKRCNWKNALMCRIQSTPQ